MLFNKEISLILTDILKLDKENKQARNASQEVQSKELKRGNDE